MQQAACVTFLKSAMPRLGLDWSGFQRVHRQVCKRLAQRLQELGLGDFAAYREYVLDHDTEWATIDACCRITISRFYRDASVFDCLAQAILPDLAAAAHARGARNLRAWSAGCGAGEEPYSLMLAWQLAVAPPFGGLSLNIVATEIDEGQIVRARDACYRPGTLRELPRDWRAQGFVASGPLLCLRPEYREGIEFLHQDLRAQAPAGPFDLILCRNVAFTYFDDAQRRQVYAMIWQELLPGGALVIGRRERLPADESRPMTQAPGMPIYRKHARSEA